MDLSTAGPAVMEVLHQACSQVAGVLKPAEEQLAQWEKQPGFYSILLSIFMDRTLDVNVRWLAVVYFKNGIERYWRRNAPSAVTEEEKTCLKQRLIADFTEPVDQIAIQLSVLVGKIARLDCPQHWQEILPTLLQAIKCDDALVQQRSLLTLHHVVKALASKRLAADRRLFAELTTNVFEFVLTLWTTHTTNFVSAMQSHNAPAALLSLSQSILSLKVLRKLATFGVRDLSQNDAALTFLSLVFQRIDEFLKSKQTMGDVSCNLVPKREKKLTLLTKVLLDVQDYHPEGFVPFITPSLEMVVRYNFTDEGTGLVYERFTVNTFNLMRSILRCELYRPAKTVEDTKNPITLEAHKIKMAFFTQSTLTEVCRRLTLHYFLLTPEDLECWDSDPENFICDEGGDSWKFSLRPCTENLYLTLMKEFRESLCPIVVQLVQQYQSPVDPADLSAVLKKDAVYNAVGLASFDLYDDIDFDQWLTSHLVTEMQDKNTNYRILRRRVIWLVGCWVGVKVSPHLFPTIYEVTLPLLQQSEDTVVRIEAALTLKVSVDVFEFKSEQFLPYLEPTFSLLFQLLKDVSECETKMQVLHVMSFVIERMRVDVRPHAEALIHYLPSLWAASDEHNLLRCCILTTLTNLVEGLGALCVKMYDFLLPVIKLSTDVSQDPHVYLGEDGLDLWHTTLQCSPQMTPGLLDLYTNMPAMLDMGGETLRTCIKIIETYILLSPLEFFGKYSENVVQSLTGLMSELKTEGIAMIYKVVELTFRLCPDQGPQLFHMVLPDIFKSIVEGQEYPMMAALQLALFCRLILNNQPFFWDLLQKMAQQVGKESSELLGAFLDSWLDKLENIVQIERKKLSALALTTLLSANVSVVLERFGAIINVCVETMHDVYKADPLSTETSAQQDCLVMSLSDPLPQHELDTEHDKRRHQLSLADPVHTLDLRDHMLQQLSTMQQQHGVPAFQELMEQVDCEIQQQLHTFLNPH